MTIFFGNASTKPIRDAMVDGLLGCIVQPTASHVIPAGTLWCADNGAFNADYYVGDDKWFTWLTATVARYGPAKCAFATAPDVVGDAAATLAKAHIWLPKIRGLGIPAAYVAQDGIEHTDTPWDEFDALFIGGSDEFKLGPVAREYIAEGNRRGKWTHMGRVNSWRRYNLAQYWGATSVDGTCLTRGPNRNLPEVLRWTLQTRLFEGTPT